MKGGLSLLTSAYYRAIRTNAVNGDINEESLDQSVYQPGAAERAALAAAGYGSVPSSGHARRRIEPLEDVIAVERPGASAGLDGVAVLEGGPVVASGKRDIRGTYKRLAWHADAFRATTSGRGMWPATR